MFTMSLHSLLNGLPLRTWSTLLVFLPELHQKSDGYDKHYKHLWNHQDLSGQYLNLGRFLKTICSGCHTRCLVAAIIKEGRAPEVITDLTRAELDKFKDVDGVRADDVLDMRNFLKDFDGDFPRLFRQG